MYDPTIYDNLKVVLEGVVYDLDLSNQAEVTARSDRLDLADMSRRYRIQWRRARTGKAEAIMSLHASVRDLAGEIEEEERPDIGCRLEIGFRTAVAQGCEAAARQIREALDGVWEGRPRIAQRVVWSLGEGIDAGEGEYEYMIETTLDFGRKIGEGHIDDLPELVGLVSASLERIDGL